MAPPVCTETNAERKAAASYRRLIVASSFGTAIEWYDFFVYALIAPLAFDSVFFPGLNPLAGTIAVYSSFAVGFRSGGCHSEPVRSSAADGRERSGGPRGKLREESALAAREDQQILRRVAPSE